MKKLEMRKVNDKEFKRSLSSLDRKGTLPLSIASGNERAIIYEGGKPVGYVVSSENHTRLNGFAIHQDYRDRGYGKRAIELLKENARKNGKRLVVGALPSTYEFFQKCGMNITDHDVGEVWLTADE